MYFIRIYTYNSYAFLYILNKYVYINFLGAGDAAVLYDPSTPKVTPTGRRPFNVMDISPPVRTRLFNPRSGVRARTGNTP